MNQSKEKTTAVKATTASKRVRPFVKDIYARALEAKEQGKPIAYCMVASQYEEILQAMDIVSIWTENYGGLCAAKRDAERFLVKAEADGFSNNICGYVRNGLGFEALRQELGEMPPDAPDGGMAKPTMLLGSSAVCDPRYKWYQALGRYLDAPVYAHDIVHPPIDADLKEVKPYYIKYQTEQFRGLVDFLEKQTGRKMDYDYLSEILDISDKTARIWWETYELRKAKPCPMPSQDHFSSFVPAYFRIGSKEALEFYEELYKEVKYRMENKMSLVPEEKYRLLWAGGLPPWHTLGIFNYFESKGAVFVMETAYRPWDQVEIPSGITDPLERIAERYWARITYRYDKARKHTRDPRVENLLELIDEYDIDGMLMHVAFSCRATTIGQIHYRNLVNEWIQIPTMFMESDIVDVRDYSEAYTKSQVDSFMEPVAVRRKNKDK